MADNFIPQVDYTSRDYASIREDLIGLIPLYLPEWTNRDASDFGIVLIELFSYMGDILNFYIDRSANEAFITTASQRENVLQLAQLLNYTPTGVTPSTATVTFQNATASAITIPALTKIATNTSSTAASKQIIFETDAEVVVPAKVGSVNGSITVGVTQGETISNEEIGISDGTSNQSFVLSNDSVISDSVSVEIGGVEYERVQYLIDYGTSDAVFTTITDAEGTTYLVFGDDISGRIPPANTTIYATYRVGGGAEGNVPTNAISYILTNGVPGISVKNQDISVAGDGAATGGADAETTDSIRINAPSSITALNRAVSISDYASLALQVDGVAKTNATADVYTSVTLYIRPAGDSGLELDEITPSSVFENLVTKVQQFLVNKIPANTTVTYQPPRYVPIDITVNFVVSPKKQQTKVKTEVGNAISELLVIDNVFFQDTITIQDIYSALQGIDGLLKADVILMVRQEDLLSRAIDQKEASGTEATLRTTTAHGLSVGDTVLISEVDSTFNGARVVTATPTTTTFKYSLISPVVATTAVAPNGSVKLLVKEDIECGVNEIPKLGTLTLNPSGGITA